jgi:hypothetical protein
VIIEKNSRFGSDINSLFEYAMLFDKENRKRNVDAIQSVVNGALYCRLIDFFFKIKLKVIKNITGRPR